MSHSTFGERGTRTSSRRAVLYRVTGDRSHPMPRHSRTHPVLHWYTERRYLYIVMQLGETRLFLTRGFPPVVGISIVKLVYFSYREKM